MRVSDRLHEATVADDYTPATDLVFSMLALTLLLLAIFGAGSHVTENRLDSIVEGNKVEIGNLIEEKNRQADEIASHRRSLDEKAEQIRRLEAELALRPPQAPGGGAANLEKLMRALKVLEQQYAEKTKQYEAIMDELKEAQRLAQPEVRLPPISAETFGAFLGSEHQIAPAVLTEVVRGLKSVREQVSDRRLNEVVLQIETGHVPGRSTPNGPDDESLDTFEIGSALQRGLWATPLPPACVSIQPLGRLRASGLVDRMTTPGSGPLMERLVAKGGALDGDALKQRMELLAVKDRRILVAVRRVDRSPCTPEALRKALDMM